MKRDVPVDIIPDKLLERTKIITDAIMNNRNENPIYMPFAPGAKTLASRELDDGIFRDRRNFDEDVFRDRRNFEEDKRQFDRSMALRTASASKSGSSNIKPPTDKERYQAIQAGAINHLQSLLQSSQETYEPFKALNQAFGYPQKEITLNKKISPEEAVNQTIQKIQSQLGDMGLTPTEYNNLVKMLYYSAGLEPVQKAGSGAVPSQDDIRNILGFQE
jgi:hypothetical protein